MSFARTQMRRPSIAGGRDVAAVDWRRAGFRGAVLREVSDGNGPASSATRIEVTMCETRMGGFMQ